MRSRCVALSLLLPAALLAACSDDEPTDSATAAPPTPSSSGPTTSTDPETGVTYIDTGGTQVLGLALAHGSLWAVSYDTSTITRIDPDTNTVLATVDVPGGASVAALQFGLWVAAYGNPGSLYRIGTVSETVEDTVPVGDLCCDLTDGAGLIWSLDRSGLVVGVDPATGEVADAFPVSLDLDAHNNVVFAGGYLWVSSDTTALFRIDPHSGESVAYDVGGGVPFLGVGGLLWGASPTELWAVDVVTGEVTRRVPVPDSEEVMALAIDQRTAWVGMRHPGGVGAVVELDLSSGEVLREVPVDIPARIELAYGSVWVSDSGSSLVLRIDH